MIDDDELLIWTVATSLLFQTMKRAGVVGITKDRANIALKNMKTNAPVAFREIVEDAAFVLSEIERIK